MKFFYISPFLVFFFVLLIQVTIVPLISIAGIVPDIILVTLVYYSISRGQLYGTVLGAFYGLSGDLITGSLLGSAMLAKTLAGFIAGYFSSETKRDMNISSFNFTIIVFICALVDSVIFAFFSAFDLNTNLVTLLFEHALLPSLYTALISILFIFFPFRRRKI
ncbi:rod shape-determining protein MreD [bacterium BMS3Abin03]|nr:rod shape-determining protein MreD [bacterium BMS3Abin03]